MNCTCPVKPRLVARAASSPRSAPPPTMRHRTDTPRETSSAMASSSTGYPLLGTNRPTASTRSGPAAGGRVAGGLSGEGVAGGSVNRVVSTPCGASTILPVW